MPWLNSPALFIVLGIAALVCLGLAAYFGLSLAEKDDAIRKMTEEQQKLMRSFNELDEQAKLIVRTDLELNKAQEELDKRLNGLNALQRMSRNISQALNEEEIFQKLNTGLFEELGFGRALIITFDEHNKMRSKNAAGIPDNKLQGILNQLDKEELLRSALQEKRTLSSSNTSRKIKERLVSTFEAEHFVIAPILAQDGVIGLVFVGNRYAAPAITQGDEELVTILASQIGQAIENAQLFEKVFRSSQELEIKVKERTKQLASALEQVNTISERKTEFISAVSHELRTPLTSIKGYAAILMAGKVGEIPDAVKERLSKINTHSDNLVSLINNLLDIARIESGRVDMKFALHPVKNILDNVADLLTPQMKDKEIKLDLINPPEVKEVYIDISHAERVFINLLSNAIKFTPKGGKITISAAVAEKGFVSFSVADTGIGIPPDDLNKLFNEFFRVENEINQNVKGTGLGLALAKNIVEAHHGTIGVTSQVGVGTTFTFTLPATAAAYQSIQPKEKA
jgi:signal transduction histidine kinase